VKLGDNKEFNAAPQKGKMESKIRAHSRVWTFSIAKEKITEPKIINLGEKKDHNGRLVKNITQSLLLYHKRRHIGRRRGKSYAHERKTTPCSVQEGDH